MNYRWSNRDDLIYLCLEHGRIQGCARNCFLTRFFFVIIAGDYNFRTIFKVLHQIKRNSALSKINPCIRPCSWLHLPVVRCKAQWPTTPSLCWLADTEITHSYTYCNRTLSKILCILIIGMRSGSGIRIRISFYPGSGYSWEVGSGLLLCYYCRDTSENPIWKKKHPIF